jgi:molybdopterin converting factor small subunit
MIDVTLKFTGNIYKRMGTFGMGFSFEGANLRDLLNELLARYNLRDLLMDDRGQIRPYARVLVNGRFSEVLQGLDTLIQTGDTVTLIHPYAVAF